MVVLVALLVGGGVFGTLKVRSTNHDLSKARAQLHDVQTQLTAGQTTIANQGSQIRAFKTCLGDISALGDATRNNDLPAAQAAAGAVAKDCTPLGIS